LNLFHIYNGIPGYDLNCPSFELIKFQNINQNERNIMNIKLESKKIILDINQKSCM